MEVLEAAWALVVNGSIKPSIYEYKLFQYTWHILLTGALIFNPGVLLIR